MRKLTFSEFLERARKAHPNENLDYSNSKYINTTTKICIIDHDINPKTGKEYGEYWQTPMDHMIGKKHPLKAINIRASKRILTTEEYIKRAKAAHPGENLDYSKTVYKNMHTKVCIIDHDINPRTGKEYGEYWQNPQDHLEGAVHPGKSKKQRLTTEEFIRRAKGSHKGQDLDYSETVYVNDRTKVCIIDHDINPETGEEYGEYWQLPYNHLKGQSHPNRAFNKPKTTKEFIEEVNRKFPKNTFDFSKTKYVNLGTKVIVIEKSINPETGEPFGEFEMLPSNLLKGQGHPEKGKQKCIESKKIDQDEFIKRAKKKHIGEKIDFSKVIYQGMMIPVCLIDHDINPWTGKEFGMYWQTPKQCLHGQHHPDKSRYNSNSSRMHNNEEIIDIFRQAHPEQDFDYSKVDYKGYKQPVIIGCPKHGWFATTPGLFIQTKYGCPKCADYCKSGKEDEVYEYICQLVGKENVIRGSYQIIGHRKQIDIYIPSKKLGIEFDGVYWHSTDAPTYKGDMASLTKTDMCKTKGIRLIHIFEDEWDEHPDLVKDKLSYIIGCSKVKKKIGARKCIIKELKKVDTDAFLEKNHIQGKARASVYLGAYYKDELVSVMLLRKTGRGNEYDLNRFASNTNYVIQGVAGKLLTYFIKRYDPSSIISFGDIRWIDQNNNLYLKLGFKEDSIVQPTYSYIKPNKFGSHRIHKFNFRKQHLCKRYPDICNMNMTEKEMTEKLGYARVYDCGLIKYRMIIQK